MTPKTVAADPRSGLDKFVDELDNLPLHASAAQVEMESVPSSTSSDAATTSPGLDSFQFRGSESTPRGGVNRRSSLKTCTQKSQPEAAWRTVRWECPLGTSNVRWEVSGMECNLSKNKTCIPNST
jgi:hypothetical protein